MFEIVPISYIFRSTWIKIITRCLQIFIEGDFLDIRCRGSHILLEAIRWYVFLCLLFTFFVRSGKVGVRSLHIMMMSTDELRDDRLREDCNFLLGSIAIP